jgi:hypothetical protein
MAVGDGEDDGGIGGITTVMMEERKFEIVAHKHRTQA